MNKKPFPILLMLLICASLAGTGCGDLLSEDNRGGITPEEYFIDEAGFNDLVKSCYAPLRDLYRDPRLMIWGTDIFTRGGSDEGGESEAAGLNEYTVHLSASVPAVKDLWELLYLAIRRCNTTLAHANSIAFDPDRKATGVAEVLFLRSLYYYLLVENWGDVPLMLDEVNAVTTVGTRAPESEVYAQILLDLESAIEPLPILSDYYGRVTRGAAQHLLARLYLTRGYRTYGRGNADFYRAAELAEAVIASGAYHLLADFADVYDQENEENQEIIFAVQYSENGLFNFTDPGGKPGNNKHKFFGWAYDGFPGHARDEVYGRLRPQFFPTPFLYSLYDPAIDSVDAPNEGILTGDTTFYFPNWNQPWTLAQQNAVSYHVINYDQWKPGELNGTGQFPPIWKFHDSKVPYGDDEGVRDTYVFQLSDTYLLAAEARLMLGESAPALAWINAVRQRAAFPGRENEMQITTITLDDILDERARELCGSYLRWLDLKRTGTLISRTTAHNELTALAGGLREMHLLRPIPQSQIDLTSNEFPQNPGY
jgi:starch-binding outer membrane protein, SusD/RagB family